MNLNIFPKTWNLLAYLVTTLSITAAMATPPAELAVSRSPEFEDSIHTKSAPTHRLARSVITLQINTPPSFLWNVLLDFEHYPLIFKRLKSVTVTRQIGNLIYVESRLKPQLFVNRELQHTVNDLSDKPTHLKWHMLDGNFNYVEGEWLLKPCFNNTCQTTYILVVDSGPIIPPQLLSFILHFVQKEIVYSLKHYTEENFRQQEK